MDIYWSANWGWVKTTGKVIWLQTFKEHLCKTEGWHLYLLMLADSEPKVECCYSLNWVTVGKAKQNGGVKWVSNPHVRVKDKVVCFSDAECSYLPKEGHSLTVEEWHNTLKENQTRTNSQDTRICSSIRGGNTWGTWAPKPPNYCFRFSWNVIFKTSTW